ncbi:MAG: hypothetical protein ACO30M_09770, partial [Candidatus Kapaibacteriota bacterium]
CEGGSRTPVVTPASGCIPAKTTYIEVDGVYKKFTKQVDNDLSTLTSIDYSIKRKSDGVTLYSVTLSAPWPSTPTSYAATLLVFPGTVSVLGTYHKSSDGTITIKSPSIPGTVVPNSDALIVTVNPSCSPIATPSGSTFTSAGGVDETVTQEYNATAIAAMSSFGKLIPGDVKYSELNVDHNGWYKLDGRAISTISNVSAQTVANALYSGTLPNMSQKYFYADHGNPADRLTYDGQNTFTVTNSNIQSATLSTANDGAHEHQANPGGGYGLVRKTGVSTPGSLDNDPDEINVEDLAQSWTVGSTLSEHSHSFTIGTASPTPISIQPRSVKLYQFVYLGH